MKTKQHTFTAEQAVEAIRARMNGVWDNEQLLKLGPISTSLMEDIHRILSITEGDIPS